MSLAKELGLLWFTGRQYTSMSRTFSKLLLGMAAVISLFIMCMQLVLFFLGSIAWLAYNMLLSSGVPPEQTGLLLSACILALLACMAMALKRSFTATRRMLDSQSRSRISPTSAVTRIVDSFMQGYERAPRNPSTSSR